MIQTLPENAMTLNMTKYITVPTNRSDDTGNIVTVMMTWGTSVVMSVYFTYQNLCIPLK